MLQSAGKNLVLIGTAHEFQEDNARNPWKEEFRELLKSIVNFYSAQIILEEWGNNRGPAVGASLKSETLIWQSINPPTTGEYSTEAALLGPRPGPDVSFNVSLIQYPFEPQEKRELYMVSSITQAMNAHSQGVLILGMNHIHSMMTKLRAAGFSVVAGNWLKLCDKGTKKMQVCEPPMQLVSTTEQNE